MSANCFCRILEKFLSLSQLSRVVLVERGCGDTFARLCDEVAVVGEPNVSRQGSHTVYHSNCLAAVRAFLGSARTPVEKKDVQELKEKNVEVFKRKCLKLAMPVGKHRAGTHTALAKSYVEELVYFSTLKRSRRRLLLTHKRFVAYYRFWYDYTKDEVVANRRNRPCSSTTHHPSGLSHRASTKHTTCTNIIRQLL